MNYQLQQKTDSSGIITLDARSATPGEGVSLGTNGVASGFTSGKGTIAFRVTVSRSGLYTLRVLARAPNGEKGFEIRVGDGPVLNWHLSGTNGPTPISFDAGIVELTAGPNTVTIGRGWGYYEIAGIELAPAPAPSPLRPVPAVPCDPKATPAARRLLKQITARYGSATLSGQYEVAESNYIKSVTGHLPAILGDDLMEYSPSRREHGANPKDAVERLIQTVKSDGSLLTLSWHWNAPLGLLDREIRSPEGKVTDARWYKGFYSNATTFNFAAALADPRSEGYRLLVRDIDAIALELAKFARAGIPILWRPLHEAAGGWFWWGTRGPEAFNRLWQLLYNRLTVTHGLHNLLWVISSGTQPAWYPGDAYVDVVGIDGYPADAADPLVSDWRTLLARFDGKKPLALTEFGGVPDIARMNRYGVRWAYFVSWTGKSGPHKMGVDALKRLYTAPAVVNRGRYASVALSPALSRPSPPARLSPLPASGRGERRA